MYSSSASVYGDAVEEPMTEDHPFNNKNFYGATKIAGEAHAARACTTATGSTYVGLRYMNVYGPRQDYRGAYIAVIMKMLDAIDRGEPLDASTATAARRSTSSHVEDCAQANVCAMKADTVDRFYNVGTGTRTSMRELAEMLLRSPAADVGIQLRARGPSTFVQQPDRLARAGAATRSASRPGRPRGRAARADRVAAAAHRTEVDAAPASAALTP